MLRMIGLVGCEAVVKSQMRSACRAVMAGFRAAARPNGGKPPRHKMSARLDIVLAKVFLSECGLPAMVCLRLLSRASSLPHLICVG
ncbi:hypothetical protein D3C84_1036650 [compost metagenome]